MGKLKLIILKMNKLILLFALLGVVLSIDLSSRDLQKKTTPSTFCQNKPSTDGRCGVLFKNTRCVSTKKTTQYCSKFNYCGSSKLHMASNQKLFGGNSGKALCKLSKLSKRSLKR